MDKENLISVAEYAKQKGVTTTAIYKKFETSLKPYVVKEGRRNWLKKEALEIVFQNEILGINNDKFETSLKEFENVSNEFETKKEEYEKIIAEMKEKEVSNFETIAKKDQEILDLKNQIIGLQSDTIRQLTEMNSQLIDLTNKVNGSLQLQTAVSAKKHFKLPWKKN
ncbi:MAG: hypothetical protein MJ232_05895 [archaeon]|nr:hypothetical protein [archaeon]